MDTNLSEDTDSSISTDDEGNAQVASIIDHKQSGKKLSFKVVFRKGNHSEWLSEKDLDNCQKKLDAYCLINNITRTIPIAKKKVGNIKPGEANPANWASAEEIIRLVKTHGYKDSIVPEIFKELGPKDTIYLLNGRVSTRRLSSTAWSFYQGFIRGWIVLVNVWVGVVVDFLHVRVLINHYCVSIIDEHTIVEIMFCIFVIIYVIIIIVIGDVIVCDSDIDNNS